GMTHAPSGASSTERDVGSATRRRDGCTAIISLLSNLAEPPSGSCGYRRSARVDVRIARHPDRGAIHRTNAGPSIPRRAAECAAMTAEQPTPRTLVEKIWDEHVVV